MASTWQSFYFAPGLRRFQHASAQYSWGQEIGESSAHWVYQTCLFGHWVRVLPTNHGGYLKKHISHDITKYFWGYDLAWLRFFVAFIAHRMRIPSKSNDSQLSFVFLSWLRPPVLRAHGSRPLGRMRCYVTGRFYFCGNMCSCWVTFVHIITGMTLQMTAWAVLRSFPSRVYCIYFSVPLDLLNHHVAVTQIYSPTKIERS